MSKVGIIANPSSGKDIRRLIASGSVFTNQEKINIMTRMIAAMDAGRVDEICIMPDLSNMGKRVIEQVSTQHTDISLIDLPIIFGSSKDTENTVLKMIEDSVDLIIVMGGDGTSRIVTKHCQDIPIIAISTGTNNVFPQMIEGTLAGMAAAVGVDKKMDLTSTINHQPIIEIRNDKQEVVDIALVDLVLVDSFDKASGAVWEGKSIKDVFLTKAASDAIGLSAIGGCYMPIKTDAGYGLHLEMGEHGDTIIAPIAPGLIQSITIQKHTFFSDEFISLKGKSGVIALDGERELVIGNSPETLDLRIHFNPKGPRVLDIKATLELAAKNGFWIVNKSIPPESKLSV